MCPVTMPPPPAERRLVHLACVGDANHRDTWSSTPYHLLEAAKPAGFIDSGLALNPLTPGIKRLRYLWNLWSIVRGRGRGGFQYSSAFLERLWAPVQPLSGHILISHFQLFPQSIAGDNSIEKWFYIDGTIKQVFEHYGIPIAHRNLERIYELERRGYHTARGIFAMSNSAISSLVSDYAVPREKIHLIVPGANIDQRTYAQLEPQLQACAANPKAGGPMRLLAIGKEWHRKGFDRLMEALVAGRANGLRAELCVIGMAREDVPEQWRDIPGVTWAGYLSRQTDSRRFFDLVLNCDVGFLISRAEFAGIAVREYLALGMPVIASKSGGIPDMIDPDCCFLVGSEGPSDEISRILCALQDEPGRLEGLKKLAQERRNTRLWSTSVEKMISHWPHPVSGKA